VQILFHTVSVFCLVSLCTEHSRISRGPLYHLRQFDFTESFLSDHLSLPPPELSLSFSLSLSLALSLSLSVLKGRRQSPIIPQIINVCSTSAVSNNFCTSYLMLPCSISPPILYHNIPFMPLNSPSQTGRSVQH
jgi:hypothetical protein